MLSKSLRIDRPTVGSSPTTPIPRLALLVGSLAFAFTACAGSSSTNNGTGGSNSSGGTSSGGSGSGGKQSGGNNAGGSQSGGNSAGGSAGSSAGSGAGGSAGSSAGGSAGSGNGGSAGSSAGGSAGSGNGGAAGSAGSSAGGSAAGAGGSAGGAGGGSTSSGSNPAGWYTTKDWGVSTVDWHGCVWTGVDCKSSCPAGITAVPGSTTSVTPSDFTAAAKEGGPYQVTGSVFNDYNSVVLLGFDLNDTPKSNDQCSNAKRNPAGDGPPAVTMPASATGIAINWSAAKLPKDFRIQIQGVKGATDPTNRWCANIAGNAPSFVPFTDFSTTCWNTTGTKYNKEPISGVAFLAPGTTSEIRPFDFTVVGFAPGTSKDDAPGKPAACGTKTGTVGTTSLLSDATKAKDASSERVAVSGTDCKTYIINNNNWGQQTSTYQALDYLGNSFTVNVTSGSGSGAGVVSFPSIYIGANGDLGVGGAYNTWSDSGLPKQISAMKSANSTFKWSGGNSGNYNAAYDIWFAKSSPITPGYNDAVSGFIMIWTFKPQNSQPIGNPDKTRPATIDGKAYHVWRGNRNATATGTDGPGRPVISYVADSTNNDFSSNLKLFFDDAVKNAADDMSNGSGITQAFSSDWYLTDVFAGFEIWNGSDAKGLKDTFTCVIE